MHISVRSGHVYHLPSPSGYKNDLTQRQKQKKLQALLLYTFAHLYITLQRENNRKKRL